MISSNCNTTEMEVGKKHGFFSAETREANRTKIAGHPQESDLLPTPGSCESSQLGPRDKSDAPDNGSSYAVDYPPFVLMRPATLVKMG